MSTEPNAMRCEPRRRRRRRCQRCRSKFASVISVSLNHTKALQRGDRLEILTPLPAWLQQTASALQLTEEPFMDWQV